MYKLIATWRDIRPEDEAAFEKHYREVHGPLAARVPGLARITLTRTSDGLEGGGSSFHRVAEMAFESPEAMERSSESDAWAAMRQDAGEMVERFDAKLEVGIGWEQNADEL